MATHPNIHAQDSGVPSTVHDIRTSPMDLPPIVPEHHDPKPEAPARAVPLEALLEVLIRTGFSKRFVAIVSVLAISIFGVISPSVEQYMSGLLGQDSARFDAIDAALLKAAEDRARDRRALADLIRLVEQIDSEQARTAGRQPTKLSASLRSIVAADEME